MSTYPHYPEGLLDGETHAVVRETDKGVVLVSTVPKLNGIEQIHTYVEVLERHPAAAYPSGKNCRLAFRWHGRSNSVGKGDLGKIDPELADAARAVIRLMGGDPDTKPYVGDSP